jgi:SAM-dependent methyltransferase
MLESLEQVLPLLICPKSGESLIVTSGDLLQTGDFRFTYDYVGSHPVLVDFDGSVLDRAEILSSNGVSVLDRKQKNPVSRAAKHLVSPNADKTDANVAAMVAELKRRHPHPRVLIIGGGTAGVGMQPFYDDPDIRLIAFDIYASPIVQFVADGHSIPLTDGCIDGVIAQAVIEHVLEPQQVVDEIHRVLSEDGLVYAETPFMQQVHESAYDFTRYTDSGHRYLFRNFDALASGALQGAADQLLRSIDYFFRSLFRSRAVGKTTKLLFFWLKYFDGMIPDAYAVDAASAVFFLGRKSGLSITPKEAIDYYQGSNVGK